MLWLEPTSRTKVQHSLVTMETTALHSSPLLGTRLYSLLTKPSPVSGKPSPTAIISTFTTLVLRMNPWPFHWWIRGEGCRDAPLSRSHFLHFHVVFGKMGNITPPLVGTPLPLGPPIWESWIRHCFYTSVRYSAQAVDDLQALSDTKHYTCVQQRTFFLCLFADWLLKTPGTFPCKRQNLT